MKKTHYTVGFLFDQKKERVLLIRKNRPKWQAGRLNGVGGHVEEGETADVCMHREFHEEVWYNFLLAPKWHHYAQMESSEFIIDCFAATGDVSACHGKTDEPVEIIDVKQINGLRVTDMIENLPWLIAMAIDFLEDGRPAFANIKYV